MKEMVNLARQESSFFKKNLYGISFIAIGVFIQLFVFVQSEADLLSLVSGICGIFSVVLCAQRKISQFVFSFIQVITYTIIVFNAKLYGEVIENIFYFITMLFGIKIWLTDYDKTQKEISVKELSLYDSIMTMVMTIGGIGLMYYFLSLTDDSQPLLDAVSTVPAFTAQILMMLKYKENWWYWLTIDIAAIFLWYNEGNLLMLAQYLFWTFNCIYGMRRWQE